MSSSKKEDVLLQAREHIMLAAGVLRPLGGEFERVSWMLEDSLMYIDEAEMADRAERGKPIERDEESSATPQVVLPGHR